MRSILAGFKGDITAGYACVARITKYNVTVDEGRFYSGDWELSGSCVILDVFKAEHSSKFGLTLKFVAHDGNSFDYVWNDVSVSFGDNGDTVVIHGNGKPEIRK